MAVKYGFYQETLDFWLNLRSRYGKIPDDASPANVWINEVVSSKFKAFAWWSGNDLHVVCPLEYRIYKDCKTSRKASPYGGFCCRGQRYEGLDSPYSEEVRVYELTKLKRVLRFILGITTKL